MVQGNLKSPVVFLVPSQADADRFERFCTILESQGFRVMDHACVVPLLLCEMKPCVSKHQNCLKHIGKYIARAKLIALVGKEAYAIHFGSGSIADLLYGTHFDDNGKTYFCFSDYRKLSLDNFSRGEYVPADIYYWAQRIHKEAAAFGKFVSKFMEREA